MHGQKFPGRMCLRQLLPRPLPLNIQNLTKIRSEVPEKWLFGQMLHGQMSPGQMVNRQMLLGQVSNGQILTGFGQS